MNCSKRRSNSECSLYAELRLIKRFFDFSRSCSIWFVDQHANLLHTKHILNARIENLLREREFDENRSLSRLLKISRRYWRFVKQWSWTSSVLWRYVCFVDLLTVSQLTMLMQRKSTRIDEFIDELCSSTTNAKWSLHARIRFSRRWFESWYLKSMSCCRVFMSSHSLWRQSDKNKSEFVVMMSRICMKCHLLRLWRCHFDFSKYRFILIQNWLNVIAYMRFE
jgi:hypothetical protein